MKMISAFALLAALPAISCSRTKPSTPASQTEEQQKEPVLPYGGEMWLKWDKSSRLAFIMGNLRGYWDGLGDGCGQATVLAQSLPGVSGLTEDVAEKTRFRCVNKLKLSSRRFESYEQVVTEFYTRYPASKSTEAQDVLQLLAYDSEGKLTARDIHDHIGRVPAP